MDHKLKVPFINLKEAVAEKKKERKKNPLPLLFTTVPFENDLLELVTGRAPGYFVVNIPDP